MSVQIRSEIADRPEVSEYTRRTECLAWYVLDTSSLIPDDWRYLGGSVRYEYTTPFPAYGANPIKEVNWLITPANDSNENPRWPVIPQFYMPNCFGDEETRENIEKFFTSYGEIVVTFLAKHRDEMGWAEQIINTIVDGGGE